MYECHIARKARDRYQFDQSLFSFDGRLILGDFMAARHLAQQMIAVRGDTPPIKASELYAAGLLDELMHQMVATYRQQVDKTIFTRALAYLRTHLGADALTRALTTFLQLFPPLAVYRGEQSAQAWLLGQTQGIPHSEIALEELLMLWISNQNRALDAYRELFDDTTLQQNAPYLAAVQHLQHFFAAQPGLDATGPDLMALLLAPLQASPDSLTGQLRYILQHWAPWLDTFSLRLLGGLDFMAEENKPLFDGGPGPIQTPELTALDESPEQYTPDTDWMPSVVLLAKNTYVWLHQLSQAYGYPIHTLDQIPDAALDMLAAQGITSLWLIGLWQRSRASQRIKQIMGNPEAASSAYAIDDYVIADDLGGEAALENLQQRAWQRGIRLASDMVPNHMAIDSRWVIEYPQRFLGLDESPFPNYTFDGPDLSNDERVGIFLEDHYYHRSDAAVVFKRLDRRTGEVRYIYHGNDGTTMPWNDTAQLDYLNPETREAVIQTILHVARQFPIIRFDAAMTLAKRHIQRLWYPQPGHGGAIASRAAFAMSQAQFDALMPTEFWREVVDRLAAEAPDTLLLAEAFWLMEGYFVRTLGMHRVYNSAFMHMLRDEDTASYRAQLRETLAFDPEILKRYVNFMTNPDEETAVEQFGKGDKYFGVFTVLATVPGLPLIGHGQFEGYAEKYGMEYRRAYHDETPDVGLMQHHQRQITPLLRRRPLFAGVESFRLYDFETGDGVNENVLAYSNRFQGQRALIFYHNTLAETSGTIRMSVPFKDAEKTLRQESLMTGLALPDAPQTFVIFRELVSGLEFIRSTAHLAQSGFDVTLGAYQRLVYLDWRLVHDPRGDYARIAADLAGRGVPSIELYRKRQVLRPLHAALRAMMTPELLSQLRAQRQAEPAAENSWAETLRPHLAAFLQAVRQVVIQEEGEDDLDVDILRRRVQALASDSSTKARTAPARTDAILAELQALLHFPRLPDIAVGPDATKYQRAVAFLLAGLEDDDDGAWLALISYVLLRPLGDHGHTARERFQEWLLAPELSAILQAAGLSSFRAGQLATLVSILIAWQAFPLDSELIARTYAQRPGYLLTGLLQDEQVQHFLGVNWHQGIQWYNAEAMSRLLHSLFAVAVLTWQTREMPAEEVVRAISACYDVIRIINTGHKLSGYQIERLLALVNDG